MHLTDEIGTKLGAQIVFREVDVSFDTRENCEQVVAGLIDSCGEMAFQFVNVLNHVALADPNLNISSPNDWGVLGSNENGQLNAPRNLTFNLRLRF